MAKPVSRNAWRESHVPWYRTRMDTSELEYELPQELIAQHPCEPRDASRLMVLDRASGAIRVDVFRNVAAYLRAGDCMVTNDTRVIRARLHARKTTGAQIEIFLLREAEPGLWTALVRPSARVKPGTRVSIAEQFEATLGEVVNESQRLVRFDQPDVLNLLERAGEIPLPPYIVRKRPEDADRSHYQTVYARVPGAVAAPTAGFHFTPETLDAVANAGVGHAHVTLHVGYGTFRPITAGTLEEHRVDAEDFECPEATASLLNETRRAGGRVIAVGTTSARVLETQYRDGSYHADSGLADLYIFPPYTFRGVDVLQTNFHLPRSSLLALVYAFAGIELAREAYRRAIEERFRFYSYGDAMLIL